MISPEQQHLVGEIHRQHGEINGLRVENAAYQIEVRHYIAIIEHLERRQQEEIAALRDENAKLRADAELFLKQLRAALDLAKQVRQAQRQYFKTRDRGDLVASKQLERQLDTVLNEETK